jgi:hypothetical protein
LSLRRAGWWRVAGRGDLGACGAGEGGPWRGDARRPALLGVAARRGSASAKTARGYGASRGGPG